MLQTCNTDTYLPVDTTGRDSYLMEYKIRSDRVLLLDCARSLDGDRPDDASRPTDH